MKTVHKYSVPLDGKIHQVEIPIGAQILKVESQYKNATLQIWALVEPHRPVRSHNFVAVGTGKPLPEEAGNCPTYHGTIFLNGGGLVLHVFSF